MAGVTRFELATSGLTGQRSNQLSYTPAYADAAELQRTYDTTCFAPLCPVAGKISHGETGRRVTAHDKGAGLMWRAAPRQTCPPTRLACPRIPLAAASLARDATGRSGGQVHIALA